ncbi:hypothetical protein D3C72_1165250 [compost metagenome]
MHFGHVARLALDAVREDVRGQAQFARPGRGGFERLLGAGQRDAAVAGKARIAGLGRFAGAALQVPAHVGGHLDLVFGDDRQRVGTGGGVRQRGAAGDQGRVIARNIGNQQRLHARRRAGQRQPAALERREMLAHAVHLADARAAAQQRLVDRLLVFQRQARGRRRQQRRAAAGNQAEYEVIGGQSLHGLDHALGGALAGGVGHRMGGFHHLDAPAVRAMAVTRDHQPRQLALPVRLHGLRHRGGGLARANHHGAALRRRRQVRRQAVGGADGRHGGIEQVAQQRARVAGIAEVREAALSLGRQQGGGGVGGKHVGSGRQGKTRAQGPGG